VEKQQTRSENGMQMFHKAVVALAAVVGLTVATDAMAACAATWQGAWKFAGPHYRTLSCQGTNLADFQLNTSWAPNGYPNAVVKLTGGTYAQVLGLTQGGVYVQGCDVDDLIKDNVSVYLNWSGHKYAPQCSQAHLAYLVAGKQP
jgi:hypothetical protein